LQTSGISINVDEDGTAVSRTVRVIRPEKIKSRLTREAVASRRTGPDADESLDPDLNRDGAWGIWGVRRYGRRRSRKHHRTNQIPGATQVEMLNRWGLLPRSRNLPPDSRGPRRTGSIRTQVPGRILRHPEP
jgi:hypothetical protein